MNKDIQCIFENYLLIESNKPVLISKDKLTLEHYKNKIALEYHFRYNKQYFSFVLPVAIKSSGEYKIMNNDIHWRVWIWRIKKKVKFAMDAPSGDAHAVAPFYFGEKASNVKGNIRDLDLTPLIDLFYEVAKKDIEEHNYKAMFGKDNETGEVFSNLYNEL